MRNSEFSIQDSELLFRFPWFERWAVRAMRWILHLPSDEDTIKFCLAAWHGGWPEVRRAARRASAKRQPVCWQTIAPYLPYFIVAATEVRYAKIIQEKTQCFEG